VSNTEFEGSCNGVVAVIAFFWPNRPNPAIPENTQSDVFFGAFNGFFTGEPRLGFRKADFWFLSD
jgi:hypothetical protein